MTDKTDVFAFGAVALEVACGRRALEVKSEDDLVLVGHGAKALKTGDASELGRSLIAGRLRC